MNSAHKLVVVRSDGIHYESEFAGWHSETSSMTAFNEAKDDKRVIYAAWFIGDMDSRSVWTRLPS